MYTDKKANKISLIYKEIQMGSGAKSYTRKGFLNSIIYGGMRKYFTIYKMTLHPIPTKFSYIWGKFYLPFYKCRKADSYIPRISCLRELTPMTRTRDSSRLRHINRFILLNIIPIKGTVSQVFLLLFFIIINPLHLTSDSTGYRNGFVFKLEKN